MNPDFAPRMKKLFDPETDAAVQAQKTGICRPPRPEVFFSENGHVSFEGMKYNTMKYALHLPFTPGVLSLVFFPFSGSGHDVFQTEFKEIQQAYWYLGTPLTFGFVIKSHVYIV